MIITNIIGGLGNQMFQYAAGLSTAVRNSTELLIDISDFEGYGLHNGFELNRVFSCDVKIANKEDVRNLIGFNSHKFIRKIIEKYNFDSVKKDSFITEPSFNYWDKFDTIKNNSYLKGYWQSDLYFNNISEQLRKAFVFATEPDPKNNAIIESVKNSNSVAIHIRRGDYLSNPIANKIHGVCEPDYYISAINYISKYISQPKFFIFSDDIDWANRNLPMTNHNHFFVSINSGNESFNDMRLMSCCSHIITANSTFSWWAAWLNSNANKIVISPKRWFVKNDINTSNLIPKEWTLM